jgi:hypothetical protein
MSRGGRFFFWLGTITLILFIGFAARVSRLYTGPPLPIGAVRMDIATDQANFGLGCATALLSPVRVAVAGDNLILVSVESGTELPVVWPSGFAAWRIDGRAEIADPWGTVIGKEGQVFRGVGGGERIDDAFHICPFGLPNAT